MAHFIVLEGGGGAGKTTQIEQLRTLYPDALFLREPGGTPAGEQIRELLFSQAHNLDPVAQLYLVHAARWQNIIENIAPALEEGRMVICDRFALSTYAYQVAAQGRDDLVEHVLETQAQFLQAGINPHYIFLDIEPKQAMQRIADTRADDTDVFDEMGMDFQYLIYQGYKQGISDLGLPCSVIDATQPVEGVTAAVRLAIEGLDLEQPASEA